ncbi:MAG: VWA domain-containing protein [Pseudomonadota bacterium]
MNTHSHDAREAAQDEMGETLIARIVEFVHLVRANGFQAGIGETLDALRVAELCAMTQSERLHWGLRALLCGNAEEWRRFDELFEAYWRPHSYPRSSRVRTTAGARLGGRDGQRPADTLGAPAEIDQAQAGDDDAAGAGGSRGGASAQISTARNDFRFLSMPADVAAMELLIQRLARRMRRRLRRRWQLARQGRRLHLRRTLRHSLRYGGTPLDPVYSRRRRQQPRLILLMDVSRSMSLYSYFFLRFARGVLGAFRDAHAFVYHTHLVPVSDALRGRDIDKVKAKLAVISLGWAGGTRIGESLRTFNEHYGRRLLSGRAVVIVVSDGLDTGAPALLAEQLAHIKRHVRKLIWLNPLLGRAGYQPLAAGMAAALPLIDVFAPVHNLETLAALEPRLVRL